MQQTTVDCPVAVRAHRAAWRSGWRWLGALLLMLGMGFSGQTWATCSTPQNLTVAAGGTLTITCEALDPNTDVGWLVPAVVSPTHGSLAIDVGPIGEDLDYTNDGTGTTDTFTVQNGSYATPIVFNITITAAASPITVSPSVLPNPVVGVAYNQTITASGGTAPYTYSIGSGSLPPGLSLSSSGVLSGIATGAVNYTFSVHIVDSTSPTPLSTDKTYNFTIAAPNLAFTPANPPSAALNHAYSTQFTGSGGTAPYTFSVAPGSNALPAGLSLSGSGLLSGTPTASGSTTVTLMMQDSTDEGGSPSHYYVDQTMTIVVANATAPGAPTIGTATAGISQASVTFTAPASDGGAAITGYTATSSPGGLTGTCASSPCAVTGLTNGTAYTFTVTATNSAGTSTPSAASNSVTPKGSQTITFSNPGTQNFGTTPTLTATASSGLAVTFSSTTTSVCTITSGGALTFITAGTCTINADQAGNSAFLAATTVSQSFTVAAVAPGAPTIGTATAGDSQASVAFTAPASDGGAAITGYTATSSPGGITGTCASSPCTVTGLANGTAYTFTVTATNSAGTSAPSAASNSVTPKGSQTITFSNPGTQNFGTTPTLTATASSGLAVTFSSTTTSVCTITSGGALTFIAAGTCSINADQAGNSAFLAATTVFQSFTVAAVVPGAPTIGTATAGYSQATVSFTPPAFNGGAAITGYIATSNPGSLVGSCAGSPCTVAGLSNGTAYTFTVTALNVAGIGAPSTASNSVTPSTNPSAAAKSVTTAYNTPASIDLTGSITGYYITSVNIVTGPTHGTVSVSGETVTYTPSSTYYGGSDSFTYSATNPVGTSAAATVTITVGAPAIPIVTAKSVTTAYNTAAAIDLSGSITGVDITTVTIGTAPTHGTVSVSGETVTYTPSSTYYGGPDSFTYTATNPGGISTPATVTITVGAPAIPTVTAKSVTTAYNTAAAIDLSGSITGVDITAVTIGTAPTHGTVSVSGETVTYTPSSTYYGGSDSFTYTVTNPGGTSTPATVTITVGAPAAPNAAAASVTTAYNTAAAIDLSGSITGVGITAVTIGTAPTHGTVSVSGETVTYTPNATYYGGSDSFTYTATNPGGTSTPATVTITVGALAAPTAAAKSVTTAYNTAAAIDLSSSITGIDITGVTIGAAPTHGTVSVSGETVTYTPSSTYYGGSDSFTYTATNPGGTSAPATVTITVGAPAAPTAAAKSVTTAYNTAAAIDLSGSITGIDITGVVVGTLPTHGTVSVSGETVTYTPSSTYYGGPDSFTYTATNPGGISTPATVTITVGAPAIPTVTAKSVTTAYNTAAAIDLSGSITGVDITAVTIGTAPTHGTVSVSGETVTYTPSSTYYGGSDSFTYTVTNPGGTSAPATVTITVGAPAAPTAAAKSVTTEYNTAAAIDLSSSITGIDITGVTIGAAPSHGTVSVSGKTVTYTPSSTYYGGSDSFTYTATNPGGTSAPATVTITVGAPAIPTVTAKSVTTAYNTAAAIDLSGSITGVDITGVVVGTPPTHGTVSISGETVTYTPSSTYYGGSDSFTYTATNPGGTSAPATVTITVGAPAAPTAAAKSVTTAYNTAAAIDLSGSITGIDITGVVVGTLPTHGTVSVSGETVTYTPSSTYYGGSDSFTYTATNPGGTSAPATVTITVGAPAAPTSAAKSVTTAYNTAAAIDLSSSITGIDITGVTIGAAPSHGTVSVSGKTVTYTPSATYYGGSDSFTYTATNPGGTSAPATVTITVGAPAAPTAAAKSVTTAYNTAAAIDLSSSITGIDITGVTIGTAPTHGTVSVSGKTVTYTPSSTYYGGSDSFTYTATNPGGTSAPATVTITVGAPAIPTVTAKSVTTAYNTAVAIDLSGSITGVDITGVVVGTPPTHGTVSISGETVTYTPSSTYYGGSDSFTYTATNPGGTSTPATVTITVSAPAIPVVSAKSVTTAYNTAASIDLSGSITGVDVTAVTIGTAPSHGTVSVSGKTVTYTPSATFYGGSDSFTYTATNPGGTSAPAIVTITVKPLDVPAAAALSVATTTGAPVLIQATAGATGPQPLVGVSVASAPVHGSASANGEQITYTPAAGFVGSDSFTYRVANHFGSSAPATITVDVTATGQNGSADGSKTVVTAPATPVTVNLAEVVPDSYVSSTVVGFSPGHAGSAVLSQPATLTFTSTEAFRGLAQVSVVMTASSGRKVTVNVLVLVSSQPDPSKNPDVLGLINAQTTTAQRFAQSQLDNIHSRLENLHDDGSGALFSNTLSVSLDGNPLQGTRGDRDDRRDAMSTMTNPRSQPSTNSTDLFPGWMRPGIGAGEAPVGEPVADDTAPASDHASSPARGPAGLGVWIGGTANFGSYDAYRQTAGFDSDSIAVNVGIDQQLGQQGLVGFSLGYNHDNSTIARDGTRSIAKGYSGALYGSYQPLPQIYLDAVLGGGNLNFNSRRRDSDTDTFLRGQRDGKQWFGSLTAGYEYHDTRGMMLSPYLRLEQSVSSLDGFSESGVATGALTYGRQTVRTSLAVLGLRASWQIKQSYGMLMPHLRLEVGHDFQGTSDTTLSYAFIPSAGSWNVLTNPYSANGTSVQVGFGLDLQLLHNLQLTTEYDYLHEPHAQDQMIRLGIKKQF